MLMKKKHLLITAIAGLIYVTVSSFSGGAFSNGQGNLTGGAGSSGTCANCHTGGTGGTTGSIEVRIKSQGASSATVDKYQPGEVYLVTLKGTNASLSRFGYQLVAQNSSNALTGSFANAPSGSQLLSSNQVAEQSSAIMQNGSGEFEVTLDWTAPSTGTGSVTFSGIINAVNGATGNQGDDPSSNISKTLTEIPASVAKVTNATVFKAYPNPVTDKLTLDLTLAKPGVYNVRVLNTNGAIVANQDVTIKPNGYNAQLDAGSWSTGIHFVQIIGQNEKRVLTVMKQ